MCVFGQDFHLPNWFKHCGFQHEVFGRTQRDREMVLILKSTYLHREKTLIF